jgi:heme/copper-type cytochrome/quinol oxidase subunit 3
MATSTFSYSLPVGARGTRASGWWGTVMLVATEASFFAYLLFSYFYLASLARGAWPTAGAPDLTLAVPNTIILLSSSGTMLWAEAGIRRDNLGRLRLGLLITFLLGTAFLVIQAVEYHRKTFTPQTDAYGSLFFTITGFHGAHVFVGLLMLLVLQARAWLTGFVEHRYVAVQNVALYWHFVDAVWVAVFFSLYITPRLT